MVLISTTGSKAVLDISMPVLSSTPVLDISMPVLSSTCTCAEAAPIPGSLMLAAVETSIMSEGFAGALLTRVVNASLLSTLAMASVVTSCRVLPLMRSRSRTKRISTPQSASESIARSEPVTCDATARMATAISGCSHGLNARVTTSSAADLLMVDAHCALSMVAIDASASDSSVSTLLVVLCHAVERRPFLFFLSRSCASMSAAVARCSIVVSFELDLSRVFGADSPPSSGISTCGDG